MPQKIIIDGYNVLHLVERYRQILQTDLESARSRFIQDLNIYRSHKNLEIIVVFDGTADIQAPFHKGGVRVMFSRAPLKADPVIIDLIRAEKRKRRITVVSSDREIVDFAKFSGSQSLSPAEFYIRISTMHRDIQLKNKLDNEMSGEELEEWKKIFGVE